MVVGGYILSITDANFSAKKINQLSNQKIETMKLKNYQQKICLIPLILTMSQIKD